jgi:protein gp37
MRTSEANWRKPLAWNRKAEASGKPWRVFTNSLADVFDNEVPDSYRLDLFDLIGSTPNLTWLLLTKRIGNAAKMLAGRVPLANVWIGASIVNQEEADRDIPKLLATPAAKRFVSYEPALGPVNFDEWLDDRAGGVPGVSYRDAPTRGLDWIIVGGESSQGGAKARPFNIEWARSTVEQCRAAGIACFVKQFGSNPGVHVDGDALDDVLDLPRDGMPGRFYPLDPPLRDRAGADPAEWPADLRTQQFP